MSTTKAITDPDVELLAERPALQAPAAPATRSGILALLLSWIGYEPEPMMGTAESTDDEDDWEKWLHGCGKGVR